MEAKPGGWFDGTSVTRPDAKNHLNISEKVNEEWNFQIPSEGALRVAELALFRLLRLGFDCVEASKGKKIYHRRDDSFPLGK